MSETSARGVTTPREYWPLTLLLAAPLKRVACFRRSRDFCAEVASSIASIFCYIMLMSCELSFCIRTMLLISLKVAS